MRPGEEPAKTGGELPSLVVAATGDTQTDYASGQAFLLTGKLQDLTCRLQK